MKSCNLLFNILQVWYLKFVTDATEASDLLMEDVVVPMATIALASSDDISN